MATGLGDRKESLLEADLTAAPAGGASLRRRPSARALPLAGGTARPPRNRERLLAAKRRFFEADAQIVTEILASARSTARTPARRSEKVSKNVTEKIFESGAEVETTESALLLEGDVTKSIVLSTTLGVAQNLIGGGSFLELFFRRFVARIAIRMVLERQLPVGFFDLFLRGVTANPEHLVVVTLWTGHRGSFMTGAGGCCLFHFLEVSIHDVVAALFRRRRFLRGARPARRSIAARRTVFRRLGVHRLGELVRRLR